jgi:hypothetical protein
MSHGFQHAGGFTVGSEALPHGRSPTHGAAVGRPLAAFRSFFARVPQKCAFENAPVSTKTNAVLL